MAGARSSFRHSPFANGRSVREAISQAFPLLRPQQKSAIPE